MAKNKIMNGQVLSLTAPADVDAGELVIVGSIVGVALHAALASENVQVDTEGVWELAKKDAADDITAGLVVYATAAGAIDKESAGNTAAGYAVAAAAAATTTVIVRLVPGI